MPELLGLPLETVFQGGTLLALITALGIWWIRGWPDRRRAENETLILENANAAILRQEYDALNKTNRKDIHDLKDALQKVAAEQHSCEKKLQDAYAENSRLQLENLSAVRHNKDEMRSMLFVIRLLIRELKRIDPKSEIVLQAEEIMAEMGLNSFDPGKSTALNTAENAVSDAKQTLASTKETCEEVKRTEE